MKATQGKLTILLAAAMATGGLAQDLRQQVEELRAQLQSQQESFKTQIDTLRSDYENAIKRLEGEAKSLREQDQTNLDDRIEEVIKLKQRPTFNDKGKLYSPRLFSTGTEEAIPGGLYFTGLFRNRIELRGDNVDFNSGSSGIDDSGYRMNGRFRLGIGAVFTPSTALNNAPVRPPATADAAERAAYVSKISEIESDTLRLSALTEFQAYGTAANNTYVRSSIAPFSLSVLTEPFENVTLYQGFLRAENFLTKDFHVQLGRQEIVLGNEMLFGNNTFFDGTTHDAVRLEYNWQTSGESGVQRFGLTGFLAKKAASDTSIPGPIQDFDEDDMAALYGTYRPTDYSAIDAYLVYFHARSGPDDIFATGSTGAYFDNLYAPLILGRTQTIGVRGHYGDIDLGDSMLSVGGEVAYQWGNDDSTPAGGGGLATKKSVHGWALETAANWRLYDVNKKGLDVGGFAELKPIITLGSFYSSGASSENSTGFQPLFINRHFEMAKLGDRNTLSSLYYPGGGRYGNMDSIPLDGVFILKLAYSMLIPGVGDDKSESALEVGAAINWAILDRPNGGVTPGNMVPLDYGSHIFGTEIDFFATYFASRTVQVGFNASLLFPGEGAEALSKSAFGDSLANGATFTSDDVAYALYLQALVQF